MLSPAISLLLYSGHLLVYCLSGVAAGALDVLAYGLALLAPNRYRAPVTAGW